MANKTVVWTIGGLAGETGLTLLLFAEGGNSPVNGAGDALTNSAYGRLTCTVTEALAGWYDAVIIDGSSNIVTERGPDAKLYFPGDIAGTYVVGNSVTWAQYLADQQYFQPVIRSVEDDKAITFLWPLTGRSFSTSTRAIDGGADATIAGAITELGGVGTKYEYSLAYAAADRPTEEGTVRYTLTDGTNTRYLTLRIEDIARALSVLPYTAALDARVSQTTIDLFVGETIDVSVAVTDANGDPVNLEALTLQLVFESRGMVDAVIIGNANITRIANTFTFAVPSALTTVQRQWAWALRNTSASAVLCHGIVDVQYAPKQDA